MRRGLMLTLVGLAMLAGATSLSAKDPAKASQQARDPNEKICETQTVLGSRLATRRVCATRAEWAERKQRERDILDRTQVQRCAIDPATGLCS